MKNTYQTHQPKSKQTGLTRIWQFLSIAGMLFLLIYYFVYGHYESAFDLILPSVSFILVLFLAIGFMRNSELMIARVSRIFIGIIFTFSGFVKAVDPLGSEYKFIDYFNEAFHLPGLAPFALPLAVLLCAVEFSLGLALLFNIKTKLSLWGVTLFMIVFTPLTLYLALENPVHDCGCFGDALILSNWETFWKNIIIDIFIIVLFAYKNHIRPMFKPGTDFLSLIIIFALTVLFSVYNIMHLPMLDFRPYKAGSYLPDGMKMPPDKEPDVYGYDYTLKNIQTKETKTIDSETYMEQKIWEDTTWTITETSEPYLIKKGYTPPIHDLTIVSNEPASKTGIPQGEDILDIALEDENFSFWLVAYNLEKSSIEGMKEANEIAKFAKKNGYNFYCLTSTSQPGIDDMREKIDPVFNFFTTDPITLKTIVRANPGLVLLKKGTVLGKWHYNDFPETDDLPVIMNELENKYLYDNSNNN